MNYSAVKVALMLFKKAAEEDYHAASKALDRSLPVKGNKEPTPVLIAMQTTSKKADEYQRLTIKRCGDRKLELGR